MWSSIMLLFKSQIGFFNRVKHSVHSDIVIILIGQYYQLALKSLNPKVISLYYKIIVFLFPMLT